MFQQSVDLWDNPVQGLLELFPNYRREYDWRAVDAATVASAGEGLRLFERIPALPIKELPFEWPEIIQEEWAGDFEANQPLGEQWGIEPEDDLPPPNYSNNLDLGLDDVERCAWYVPFHMLRPDWGIHVRQDCLDRMAYRIYRTCPGKGTIRDARLSAYAYFFLHELFHHITEVAAVVMESVVHNPHLYLGYSSLGYSRVFRTPWCFEEALANRYLYGRYQFARLDERWLWARLIRQSAGYRDFAAYRGPHFWRGRRRLASQMLLTGHGAAGAYLPVPHGKGGVAYPLENLFDILPPEQYLAGHRVPPWIHPMGRIPIKIRGTRP